MVYNYYLMLIYRNKLKVKQFKNKKSTLKFDKVEFGFGVYV